MKRNPCYYSYRAIEPVSDTLGRGDYCSRRFTSRKAAMDDFHKQVFKQFKPWTNNATVVLVGDDMEKPEYLLLPALVVAE